LLSSYDVLKKSLYETTFKLKILAKSNVVDAGAKGFVLFVEGIIEYIHTRNFKELVQSKAESVALPKTEEIITEDVEFRYCTEAILKNTSINSHDMMNLLQKYDKMRRIHVHTNNPADLFYDLKDIGTITFQKADDMIRQSDAVFRRKYKIALVTDSTCDLAEEIIDHYQIHVLPVNISFGETHYLDKITLKPEQFYKLLNDSPDYPKSSQINEKSFVNLYSHLSSHYDSVIAVNLSDKLSGTFHTSLKAAQIVSREFGKPISVINSKNLSGAEGLVVLRVAEAIDLGFSHDQILTMVEKWVKDTKIYVTVINVKWLIKGGRLSFTKGMIARLLNINPIISIDETGKATVLDKSFNRRSNMLKIIEHVKNQTKERPVWNYIVMHANNPEDAQWYVNKLESLTGKKPVSVMNISPIIGANAGVGASAVAFMNE
jgi:DegV family protein with EDD domain